MLKFCQNNPRLILSSINNALKESKACTSTVPDRILEDARKSKLGEMTKGSAVKTLNQESRPTRYTDSDRDYKFVYPDFLPNPVYYFRDKVRERLERLDMINRRKRINIPEFYVGSIMAVTVSDPYAPGKANRFVGICIRRENYGLRHSFTLRNTIDGVGVEILYDMYNPTIQSIEVLKLEKRLDNNLSYLMDCPPEYSTIPFDIQPVKLLPGQKVPVNAIKVPLNKPPWRHKWDRKHLSGVTYPSHKEVDYVKYRQSSADFKPHEKWDMMKHYRESIHDQDHKEIVDDLKKFESDADDKREVVITAKKLIKTRRIPGQKSYEDKK